MDAVKMALLRYTAEMSDLFTPKGQWEHLNLPDADVSILRGLPLPEDALARLINETPWRQDEITLFGKRMLQPRLHAWYGDAWASYTYSGLCNEPLSWTPLLFEIKIHVERACSACFNSVLLNLYRNENDSMGAHSDDEPELGPAPVIASLSLGTTRTFIMKHRTRRALGSVRIRLDSGSLLLMHGATQAHWKHSVPKQSIPCDPRINLTFRTVCTH
jgi:alkylated DNA repair dioxygenase AlkB